MVPLGLPRTLLLPVETANREFDGKLLLALKALERGYSPIIGSRTAMHAMLPSLPRSIYLAKGARSGSGQIFALLEALGHVIVALDEEALVRLPDEAFHMKLDPITFNRPRLLYAWGKSNADVWRGFKDYGGAPIVEVGNPRIDMLRPEIREFYREDCAALRKEYGRFILLSSNFAFVNHFIPGHVRFRVRKTADKSRSESVKSGFVTQKRALFEHFTAMVPELARAIAPHSLVIRPHPSESLRRWEEAAQGLANVHVVHRGPMTPWLLSAHALVHNGCTSAVEAAVLGKRAYAYRPSRSPSDLELPNSLSVEIDMQGPLIDECRKLLSNNHIPQNVLSKTQENILGLQLVLPADTLACDRILDSLDDYQQLLAAPRRVPPLEIARVRGQHAIRQAYRAVLTRMKNNKSSASYTRHKFPDMTAGAVGKKIETFRRLGIAGPAGARELRRNIFTIAWERQ